MKESIIQTAYLVLHEEKNKTLEEITVKDLLDGFVQPRYFFQWLTDNGLEEQYIAWKVQHGFDNIQEGGEK